jgi:hypothetical protein
MMVNEFEAMSVTMPRLQMAYTIKDAHHSTQSTERPSGVELT